MLNIRFLVALALTLCVCTTQAQDGNGWIVRAGIHPVQPQPRNHPQVRVGDGAAITLAATYMMDEHWGIEAVASLPIEHDMYLRGRGAVASFKQLPPTLFVQYRFLDPNGNIRVCVGAGLNYTSFFGERTTGAWSGAELSLRSSLGPSVQLGLELDVNRTWFVSLDARWMDLDTRARLNDATIGTIDINPYAIGMSIGRRLQ